MLLLSKGGENLTTASSLELLQASNLKYCQVLSHANSICLTGISVKSGQFQNTTGQMEEFQVSLGLLVMC